MQRANFASDQFVPAEELLPFVKHLLRCQPPSLIPNEKVTFDDKSCNLEPWVKLDDLQPVGLSFSSYSNYSQTFFPLIVEECRQTRSLNVDDSSNFIRRSKQYTQAATWRQASFEEITCRTGSRTGVDHASCMLTLKLKIMLRNEVTVSTNSKSTINDDDFRVLNTSSTNNTNYSFSSGDLIYLQNRNSTLCDEMSRPFLGLVQSCDCHQIPQDSGGSINQETLHILVYQSPAITVASVTLNAESDIGITNNASTETATENFWNIQHSKTIESKFERNGWVDMNSLYEHAEYDVICLKNVTPSIREVLALDALKSLNTSLQNLIYSGKISELSNSSLSTIATLQQPTKSRSDSVVSNTSMISENSTSCVGPKFVPPLLWEALTQSYNNSQIQSIRDICISDATRGHDNCLTLLQGPPGTGKTKTILGILSVLLCGAGAQANKRKGNKIIPGASMKTATPMELSDINPSNRPRVLICAPSNIAVDEITGRLIKDGVLGSNGKKRSLNVVRVGQIETLSSVASVSLDTLVNERRKMTNVKQQKYANRNEKVSDLWREILEEADVVCCTLSGAGSPPMIEFARGSSTSKFIGVIIDEAAQAVEPSTLIPLKYGPKTVVLVGDANQLQSTVFSSIAKSKNYGQSLFQRLSLAGYPSRMLDMQYRMHPLIARFPSFKFYHDALLTSPSVAREKDFHKCSAFRPFVIHNIISDHNSDHNSLSNLVEAEYSVDLYIRLQMEYPSHQCSVAVITPYKAQKELITKMFRQKYGFIPVNVEIATVDAFQGREVDIAIVSAVRAVDNSRRQNNSQQNLPTSIGFLSEWQRLNVAITRSKYALWLICNTHTLSNGEEWAALIDHAKQNNCIVEVPNKNKGSFTQQSRNFAGNRSRHDHENGNNRNHGCRQELDNRHQHGHKHEHRHKHYNGHKKHDSKHKYDYRPRSDSISSHGSQSTHHYNDHPKRQNSNQSNHQNDRKTYHQNRKTHHGNKSHNSSRRNNELSSVIKSGQVIGLKRDRSEGSNASNGSANGATISSDLKRQTYETSGVHSNEKEKSRI